MATQGRVLLGRTPEADGDADDDKVASSADVSQVAAAGKVLITGVSGYLGSWCAHRALEAGFEVVGTVRDAKGRKSSFLRDAVSGKGDSRLHAAAASRLRLVEVDLLSGDEAWQEVLAEGFDYVIHTASPFFFKNPRDPNDYIRPAVEGTTSVLKAAIGAGVKRAVVTSSTVAIHDPPEDGVVYTAKDWSDVDRIDTYSKSKVLAEKAAWKVVEGTGMELVVINPSLVFGPTLYTDPTMLTGFESGIIVKKMISGSMPMLPNVCVPVCNVGDVSFAHVAALTAEGAAGKRLPVCTATVFLPEVVKAIAMSHPQLGLKARKIPRSLLRCAACCSPGLRTYLQQLDKKWSIDTAETTSLLGLPCTSLETTMQEMVHDLLTSKGSE